MTGTFADRFSDYESLDDDVTDSDLVGYRRPMEIVEDPQLSLERKRELLAYWASDIHAVAGSPALRSYAFGLTVSIDAIFEALNKLDEMAATSMQPGPMASPSFCAP